MKRSNIYDDLISANMDKWGNSLINSANRSCSEFVEYVNEFYPDNSQKLSLIVLHVRESLEKDVYTLAETVDQLRIENMQLKAKIAYLKETGH